MMLSLNEEIAIALAIPFLMVVAQISISIQQRVCHILRVRCIGRISRMIMSEEEPTDREILSLRRLFPRGVITDSVTFIAEYLYGKAHHRLALIIEVCKIECSLLRETQLQDISAFIEAYPDRAIQYVARIESSLSWYEIALLTQLMRRTGASITYTPLLKSQNRNLQLIGIYVCELFAISDAEPYLQQLVESEDEEVAYTALLTLCSIRADIASPRVSSALPHLADYQRTAFVRHAVQACYSLQSCTAHLSDEEQKLFLQLSNSYKCQIVCN